MLVSLLTLVAADVPTPHLVNVGTHKLDVIQAGHGDVTVVFEAGLGDTLDAWQHVWPTVAETAPVVVYSRSGLGRSEHGPRPHSAAGAVEDLHTLLDTLHVKRPLVLAGASYGGMLTRLYTSKYPADVAGLVIVEGVHEQQVKRWGQLDPTYPAAFRASFDESLRKTPDGAEAEEIRETLRIQADGAVEGMKPLPDIPIAVLTSMKFNPNAEFVNGTLRGHQAWRAMHDEWFQRSSNGIHVETSRSGHHIQDDEPQLVIDAINFVLTRVQPRD